MRERMRRSSFIPSPRERDFPAHKKSLPLTPLPREALKAIPEEKWEEEAVVVMKVGSEAGAPLLREDFFSVSTGLLLHTMCKKPLIMKYFHFIIIIIAISVENNVIFMFFWLSHCLHRHFNSRILSCLFTFGHDVQCIFNDFYVLQLSSLCNI